MPGSARNSPGAQTEGASDAEARRTSQTSQRNSGSAQASRRASQQAAAQANPESAQGTSQHSQRSSAPTPQANVNTGKTCNRPKTEDVEPCTCGLNEGATVTKSRPPPASEGNAEEECPCGGIDHPDCECPSDEIAASSTEPSKDQKNVPAEESDGAASAASNRRGSKTPRKTSK